AGVILVDETPAFLRRGPVLAGDLDRRLDARGRALDRRQCLARLRRHDRRHLRLENAGLLRRDLADGIAEMFGVIERYRRDHGGKRALDDIGGIKPSAQADFEQQHVGWTAREQQQPRRRRDLEYGDGRARVDALAFVERARELLVRSEAPLARGAEPKALV